MEIKHLTSFVAVAELGSMTAAAKRVNLSQGTVSLHIRTLEDELQCKFFIRHAQHVELSEMGQLFLPRAVELIRREREAKEEISSRNGHICGTISIGAGCFIEPLIGYDIAEFMTRYPDVHVHMYYDYAYILNAQLRSHELDIAFSMNEGTDEEGIISTTCYAFQLYAIMSRKHPLAKKKRVTFDDLSTTTIIMPDSGKRSISTIQKYIAPPDMQKILNASRCECNNANSILRGLERLNAVTFMPKEYVFNRTDLVAIPVQGFERRVNSNYHIMRDAPQKAAVKALLEIIEKNRLFNG